MDHRLAVALAFVVISIFFLFGFPNVVIKTIFKKLLPRDDPFVQVYTIIPTSAVR